MYGIKWVYFDLDGTLVDGVGDHVSKRTLMSLMYLKSKGIKIGVATGRTPFYSEGLAKNINIDLPLITINGSWILRNDNFRTIKENVIELNSQNTILKILNENKINYMVYTTDGIYTTSENIPFFKVLFETKTKLRVSQNFDIYKVEDKKFFHNIRIFKFMIHFSDDNEKIKLINMIKNVENIAYCSSQKNVLDIFSSEVDKSIAIKWLMDRHKIKNYELMVFGDGENDIKMFQLTNYSVALCNAPEKVKNFAKMQTDFPCNKEGVAEFIFKHF